MKKLLEKFLALSKKTRIISIVLAAVILCGAITGIAIGASKCGSSNEGGNNSTPTSSVEESSGEEEPEIKSFSPKVGEPCTISFIAGELSAEGRLQALGTFTIAWTGNATIKYEGNEISNGAQVELKGARTPIMLYPTDTTQATVVVLTISEVEKETNPLVLGDNAVEFKGESVAYSFTADEAGTYILSLAEGEENAAVSCEYLKLLFDQNGNPVLDENGNQMSNDITEPCEVPYEITLAKDQTITFYVSAKDDATTEDTINLVWSKKL